MANQSIKVCLGCGVEKPNDADHFYRNGKGPNKLYARCKDCMRGPAVRRIKEWRKRNPERRKQQRDKWFQKNPNYLSAYQKQYRMTDPTRTYLTGLTGTLRQYGMTIVEYDTLYANQSGLCAICELPYPARGMTRLHVDHDHKTGQVRALLCRGCNTSLGNMHDSPDLLRRAAIYLEDHNVE